MTEKSELLENILVVDDEEDYLNLMVLHLKKNGYQVTGANGSEKALEFLEDQSGKFAVMITDWMMPYISGNNLIRMARQIDPLMESIMITSFGPMSSVGKKDIGAFEFLTKPLSSIKDLSEAVERAVNHRRDKIHDQKLTNGSQPG